MGIALSEGVSATTPIKHAQFKRIIGGVTAQASATIRKHGGWAHGEYLYFDLNAGSGEAESSSLAFLDSAVAANLPFRAWLFEIERASAEWLESAVAQWLAALPDETATRCAERIRVVRGDHAETAQDVAAEVQRRLLRPAFGLVYADPNGTRLPMEALSAFRAAPRVARADVLAYVAANSGYKRPRGSPKCSSDMYLSDDLGAVGKQHWWLRRPMGAHQWTFVAGSNYPRLAVPKSLGFVYGASAEGHDLMQVLNLSERERGQDDEPPR